MYWEAMRTPALHGEYDVTDGSVDYYDTDWENVENNVSGQHPGTNRPVCV